MRAGYLLVPLFTVMTATAMGSPREPQVVGGEPVTAGQFPFVVGVFSEGGACTGSLIRDNWVLTAAHCAAFGTPVGVLIGDAVSGTDGPNHIVTLLPVAQWIPHPQYDDETNDYDIALIRLASNASQFPPRLNGAVQYVPQPLQLASTPSASGPSVGSVSLVGFGNVDNNGPVVPNPGFAFFATGLPSRAASDCSYLGAATNASRQLCYANYPNACQGDSGGPVFQVRNNTFVQVGVVSYGAQTCGTGPSVATFVPGFVSWINQQIDGTPPPPPSSPIKYGWELPPPASQGVATGVSNIQGWTYSTAGSITSVRIERNGQHFLTIPCCSERGDVKGSNPSIPVLTGFSAASSWGLLGNGPTQITLVIRDSANNELRETRTINSVQPFSGVPRVTNLGFLPTSSCEFRTENGVAKAECSNLTFTQGTCNGRMTFAWSNGKGAFELFDGCH